MLTKIIKKVSVQRTLRLKVIIAASLLAIVPVILLGLTTYMIASHSLMEEIGKANRDTMKQIQERIDTMLVTIDKIVLQHAYSPVFKEFLSLSNPYEDPQKFKAVMTVLTSMEVLISDVDSVYLYMNEQNLIVSPSGGLTSASKLDPYILENITAKTRPFFWLDQKSDSSLPRGGSHVVTLVRNLTDSSDKLLGSLIININERAFFKIIRNMQLGNREMLIITPSSNIFSDWNKQILKEDFLQYPFIQRIITTSQNEEIFLQPADNEDMVVNYLKSPYNEWKYVSVVPYEELTLPFQQIKQTILAACILLIIISLTAAAGLSKRYFSVVHNLLELMKKIGGSTPQPHKEMDEFGLIRHYVESIQSTKNSLEQQIQESMPLLRANFIQRLLTAQLDASEIQDKLDYYHIPTHYPYFSVICIELDNLRGQTEQDVNLFLYAAINIAGEIVSHHADGMVVKTQEEHIAVIVNHGLTGMAKHESQAEIFHIAEEIREVIERLLNITATIGVGHYYNSVEHIHTSYRESIKALQYQLVEGNGRVLFIDRVHPGLTDHVYPIEQEQLILNHIKMGNLSQIYQHTDDFAVLLKKQEHLSYDHVRQTFTQLIAASLRTLYELDPAGGPSLFTYNLYQRLNKFRTIDQMVNWLKHEVFPTIVQHITHRRSQRNHETIEKALEYIHTHYDEDLSQPYLADLLSIPVSHFSHMFKDQVGMTFTDYIIAYRIEKAKELLATTDMKVSEIADRLRYNNSQNFIRMFKKITTITPGEYRSRKTN
ncbi:MAG: AraC family transcriptional regulator [Paenibacillus sp.]|nr:AraC family transcriptional regulator [Paenibacillus sp.]